MIPISGAVLVTAAVVASPALYAAAVTGAMPLEVALTRYLLVTGACWVLLSLASELVWPRAAPAVAPVSPDVPAPEEEPVA